MAERINWSQQADSPSGVGNKLRASITTTEAVRKTMVDNRDIRLKNSGGGLSSTNPLRLANPHQLSANRHSTAFSSAPQNYPIEQRSVASKPSPSPTSAMTKPAVSLRWGDTLWEVAEKKLGDGIRWHELHKADGSRFTGQEARHLPVSTQVYLPGAKPTPPSNPTVSVRSGDNLWKIAQKQLGNGNRWGELRKTDGSKFTGEEARHLQVGTQVHLTGAKITTEPPHPVTLRPSTPRVSTQVLRGEGITRRELTASSTPSTRSNQFNASPALFSRTSQVSSQVLSAKGITRSEWNNAHQPHLKPQPVQPSKATQPLWQGERRLLNNPIKAESITPLGEQNNNNALNQISSVVTGTAVGIKTKEFFLGRRLEKDPRALALAERKIKAQLGDNGMKAFRRISDLKSPREAYAILRHYIDHASKVPGSKKLLSNLGVRGNTAIGAIGEIRQIPKSRIRRSRIELVADRFKGREGADRIYKTSPFSGRKLVVDVKNYDFTKPFYKSSSNLSRKNKEFNAQIERYREKFPGTRIKYEFVGRGRVPSGIKNNLREQGVRIKVPTRTRVLNAANTVRNSRATTAVVRGARAVTESRAANTTLRVARAAKESRAASGTLRVARAAKESRAASGTLRATRAVTQSGVTKGVLRGASRVAAPVAVGLDAWQLKNAYQQDGFGKEFRKTAGSVAGAWGGAAAGAAIGSAIFPGVGTVVGGAIGGIAGSAWGDDIEQGAEKAGKGIKDGAKKAWHKLFG